MYLKRYHRIRKEIDQEGLINYSLSTIHNILAKSIFSTELDKYYSSRRFDFKSYELKSWRYNILSWIPEKEHQLGRLMNLDKVFKSLSQSDIKGDIIEFGSYKGFSLIWMARLREKYNLQSKKIIAVDSFEGLPESSTVWIKGQMSDTSLNSLKRNLIKYLSPEQRRNIFIIKGLFSDKKISNEISLLTDKGICLSHIDCDLGTSCNEALKITFRHLNKSKNLFLLFDDWGCSPDEIPKSWHEFYKRNSKYFAIEFSKTELTKYFYIHK